MHLRPLPPLCGRAHKRRKKGYTYLTHINKEILYLYVYTHHRQDRTSGTEQHPYKINPPMDKGKGNKISNRHTMANNTRRLTEEGNIETNPGFDNWEDYDSDPEEPTLDEEDLNIGPDPPPIDRHMDKELVWENIHITHSPYQEQDVQDWKERNTDRSAYCYIAYRLQVLLS